MRLSAIALMGLSMLLMPYSQAADRDYSKDEAAIRAKLKFAEEGWAKLDAKLAMEPYVKDDRLSVFDAPPPLEVRGYAGSLKTTQDVMNAVTGPVDVKYSDIRIIVDNNHAYGYYFVSMLGQLKNGKPLDFILRVTDVWERQKDGDWLIIHEQNSVPFDFETGKAYFKAPKGGSAVPFANPELQLDSKGKPQKSEAQPAGDSRTN